tara:strand:- start:63 stop:248 length:186 start_codon:yes stop_codon:yes gene_type:complete
MSKEKEIFVRYGVGDLILSKETDAKITSKYVVIPDVGEVELYLVGYENEDGEECNEDGTLL